LNIFAEWGLAGFGVYAKKTGLVSSGTTDEQLGSQPITSPDETIQKPPSSLQGDSQKTKGDATVVAQSDSPPQGRRMDVSKNPVNTEPAGRQAPQPSDESDASAP